MPTDVYPPRMSVLMCMDLCVKEGGLWPKSMDTNGLPLQGRLLLQRNAGDQA